MSQQVTHPYLNVKIDSVDITQQPDYIMDFSYTKSSDKVGTATITLYDDMAMQIEGMLIEGFDNIEFSYGMTPQTAKTYTGKVVNWDTELAGWGAILTVEIISTGVKDNGGGIRGSYQGSPDEVVRAVAADEGWNVGIIEPCSAIPFTDPATGSLQYQVWIRDGLDSLTFLRQKVLPYARSKNTGNSGYFLYTTDSNGTTINFHTKDFNTQSKIYDLTFVIGSNTSDVLSWKPGYEGSVFLACKGMIVEYQDETGTLQKIIKGDQSSPERKIVKVRSQEEARVLADYMWELKLRVAYTGSLTVVNHEGIEMFDKISVLALTKNNVPHHSSGVYLVTGVTDTIEGGLLRTELQVLGGLA